MNGNKVGHYTCKLDEVYNFLVRMKRREIKVLRLWCVKYRAQMII